MVSWVTVKQNKTWRKVRPGNRGKCIKESNDHGIDNIFCVKIYSADCSAQHYIVTNGIGSQLGVTPRQAHPEKLPRLTPLSFIFIFLALSFFLLLSFFLATNRTFIIFAIFISNNLNFECFVVTFFLFCLTRNRTLISFAIFMTRKLNFDCFVVYFFFFSLQEIVL